MAINAKVDNTTYEGIEKITAGGKTVELTEVFSGSKVITANGTHDVSGYAQAVVEVPTESTGGNEPTGSINITTNGTHDVSGYAQAVVNVPQEGYDVDDFCNGNTLIFNKAENVETSVTRIRDYAFAGMRMNKVTAPNLTAFSKRTFIGNTNLTEVDAPEVTDFNGNEVFLDCTKLVKAHYPKVTSVYSTYSNMFSGCTALVDVNLDGMTDIREGFFNNCKALANISLPSLKAGYTAKVFYGCTSLTNVNMPLFAGAIGISMFENCTSLEEISFPSATRFDAQGCFKGCTALKKVDLGENCASVASTRPFENCTALETVILRYNGVVTGNTNTFANAAQAKTVYVPAAQLEAYQADSYWGGAAQTSQGVTLAVIEGSEYE